MRRFISNHRPALVLAPMQDVTDHVFMRALARRGAPDWFVTEYFRVHPESRLDKKILKAITENATGRPVFAQMIGSDIAQLARTARELATYPVAGIDLNLGCPAPIVCRKNAGGGILRDLPHLDAMVGTLRETIPGSFTVKTRIGYASEHEFPAVLDVLRKHAIDGLTLHARTVRELYNTPIHTDCLRLAVDAMPCPVVANGNIVDAATAVACHARTGAAGLMVGRGAIRYPWIFAAIRAAFGEGNPPSPTHRDALDYIGELYDELAAAHEHYEPRLHVQGMKRLLAYISQSGNPDFEYAIRRVTTRDDFFRVCHAHLDHPTPWPAMPDEQSKLFRGFCALLENN